jgi:hypothetical protein
MHKGVRVFRKAILDAYSRLAKDQVALAYAKAMRGEACECGITTDDVWQEVKRFAEAHGMLDAVLCWDSNRPARRNYSPVIDSIIRHGELWPLSMSRGHGGRWYVGEEIPF